MTTRSFSFRAGLLLLAAAGFFSSACGPSRSSASESAVVVSQADVERLRIGLLEALREINGSLTQLEAQAALVDSTERAEYQQRLDALYEDRDSLETQVASLAAGPEPSFDSLETALTEATIQLDRRVEKSHFVLAKNTSAVRALSIPRLALLEEHLAKTVGGNDARLREIRRALQQKRASITAALENLERFSQEPETAAHWRSVVGDRFADLRGAIARASILQDSLGRIPQRDTIQTLGQQAFETPNEETEQQTPPPEPPPTPRSPDVEEPPAPQQEEQPEPTPPPEPEPEPAPEPEEIEDPSPAEPDTEETDEEYRPAPLDQSRENGREESE